MKPLDSICEKYMWFGLSLTARHCYEETQSLFKSGKKKSKGRSYQCGCQQLNLGGENA
jgi:hypothetical protein